MAAGLADLLAAGFSVGLAAGLAVFLAADFSGLFAAATSRLGLACFGLACFGLAAFVFASTAEAGLVVACFADVAFERVPGFGCTSIDGAAAAAELAAGAAPPVEDFLIPGELINRRSPIVRSAAVNWSQC